MLLKANVDAFAHSVRDRDVDPEFLSMMKQRPNITVNQNLPSPGRMWDTGWLQKALPADEYAAAQKANVNDPKVAELYGIQARNLKKLSDQGTRITLGTDGNTPWGAHQEMEAMAMSGMTAMQVIVEEAGGRFSDRQGAPRIDGRSSVASNGLIHDELLAALGAPG